MIEIVKKWRNTGLLEIFSKEKAVNVALALENQRIFNEKEDLSPHFRRTSIPILVRLFASGVQLESNLTKNFGNPVITPIVYNNKAINLDEEAKETMIMVIDIKDFIKNWASKNDKTRVTLEAIGVEDNKIALYGLK